MLIKRLHLKNLLSFKDTTVELGPLNVLIGPNAVGKSNLIEAIGLLQATPTSLNGAILRGGGVRQWIWLGEGGHSRIATIECDLELNASVSYQLQFSENSNGFAVLDEQWSDPKSENGTRHTYLNRVEFLNSMTGKSPRRTATSLTKKSLPPPPPERSLFSNTESLLSQYKNPADKTYLTEIGRQFSQIKIFREFRTGPQSPARYGISTSLPKSALLDGSDNLALVLLEMDFHGVDSRIRSYLQRFCERFEDVKVNIGEGLAQTYLREAGLSEMLSAMRMSDGTLKFLALLAALFHPSRPPMICVEEPEIGMHPDALQIIAEALVDASETSQLVVTTHSEALIDALSDRPESVLVCERDFDNGTQMKRLSKRQLKEWLQRYTLGQLWRKGEIGGGRW